MAPLTVLWLFPLPPPPEFDVHCVGLKYFVVQRLIYFPHCRTSKDAKEVIFTRQGAREMDEAKSDFQSTLCATKCPEVFSMLTD